MGNRKSSTKSSAAKKDDELPAISPQLNNKFSSMKNSEELIDYLMFHPPAAWDPTKTDKATANAIANNPELKRLFVKDVGNDEKALKWNYQKFKNHMVEQWNAEQLYFLVEMEELQVMVDALPEPPAMNEPWPEEVTEKMKAIQAKYLDKSGEAQINMAYDMLEAVQQNTAWYKKIGFRTVQNDALEKPQRNVKLPVYHSVWLRTKQYAIKEIVGNYENAWTGFGPMIKKQKKQQEAQEAQQGQQDEQQDAQKGQKIDGNAVWESYGSDYVGVPSWYGDSQRSSVVYGPLQPPYAVGYAGSPTGPEALVYGALSVLSVVLGLMLCLCMCAIGCVIGYVANTVRKPKVLRMLKINDDDEPRLPV